MSASNQRFLDPHLLMELGTMELRARTVVEGFMAGLHRSPFRGLSMEFAEYRQYQPGDDPRRLDWKAYARSDKYYIREFEDESNLNSYIILDASASMGFGSSTNKPTKWQYGGILAAALAFLLQRQRDNVGLVIMDEKLRVELPPRATRDHLYQVITQMENTTPSRGTRLAPALHHVAARLRRKGMVIVISDLLDNVEEVIDGLQHLQFGGSEVIVFQTLDPAELRFEFQGPMLFQDPETSRVMPALADSVKKSYLGAIGKFISDYAEAMGKVNISHILTDTARPLDEALLGFLMGHARRQ